MEQNSCMLPLAFERWQVNLLGSYGETWLSAGSYSEISKWFSSIVLAVSARLKVFTG